MANKFWKSFGMAVALVMAWVPTVQADTVLEVLHAWPGDSGNYTPIADAFMQAHPGVKVEFRVSPPSYNDAHQVVVRNAMTGDLPDVYFSGYSVLRPLIAVLKSRNQAVPLTPFLQTEGKAWVDQNYSSAILSLGQVDGVQYGIPFNASTPIVYFNADLVKRAGGDPDNFPSDWNGLIDLAKKIDALGDDIHGMDYSVGAGESDWLWQTAILERGGKLISADEKGIGYDNDLGLNALTFLRHVAEATKMHIAANQDEYRQLFFAGKLGMFFSSPSSVKSYTETVGTGSRCGQRSIP